MKYNAAQKDKVVRQKLSLRREEVEKRRVIRLTYPVEVEIQGGFYIIESKINTDETD